MNEMLKQKRLGGMLKNEWNVKAEKARRHVKE